MSDVVASSAPSPPKSMPDRPSTSQTTRDRRTNELAAALAAVQLQDANVAAAGVGLYWDMPQSQARRYVDECKAPDNKIPEGREKQMGCWVALDQHGQIISRKKPHLRNVIKEGTDQLIGTDPYIYHLALIGVGKSDQVRKCAFVKGAPSGTKLEVSHLCHNDSCFNPRHLVVETAVANKLRNDCGKHARNVLFESGAHIEVCPHATMGPAYVSCLLQDTPPLGPKLKGWWRINRFGEMVKLEKKK